MIRFEQRRELAAHASHGCGEIIRLAHVNLEAMPAQDIGADAFNRDDAVFVCRDQHCTPCTGFADVPALQIAGEDNPRIGVQYGVLVNMAQSPVLITFRYQFSQRTRGVAGMRCVAFEGGVQDADVERVALTLTEVIGQLRTVEEKA